MTDASPDGPRPGTPLLPAGAGMRSVARLLRTAVEQVGEADGADRAAALDQAEDAAVWLGRLVGLRMPFPPMPPPPSRPPKPPRSPAARTGSGPRRLANGLRADAERMVRLVDLYTGVQRRTPWHRLALRGASLSRLAARVSARTRMLRIALDPPRPDAAAQRAAVERGDDQHVRGVRDIREARDVQRPDLGGPDVPRSEGEVLDGRFPRLRPEPHRSEPSWPAPSPGGLGTAAGGGEPLPGDWSPVVGAHSESFGRAMRRTQCLFTQRSTIWVAPPWPAVTGSLGSSGSSGVTGSSGVDREGGSGEEAELPAAVADWSRNLRGFAEACRREPLDGFVLVLPGLFGSTVGRLAWTTRRVLEELVAHDGPGRCDLRRPEREEWCFTFGGERMSLVTMAPCYPADHSRHNFGEPYTFLLFQPKYALDRVATPGEGDDPISAAVRDRIRERYQQHGRPYDLSITLSPYEAHRFVRPAVLGDPPVRWWESGDPEWDDSEGDVEPGTDSRPASGPGRPEQLSHCPGRACGTEEPGATHRDDDTGDTR